MALQLVLVLLLVFPSAAQTADVADPDYIPQAKATLDRIEKQLLSAETATREELKAYENELDSIRSPAQKCVATTEKELAKLEKELAILRPGKARDADAEKPAETKHDEQAPEAISPEIARQLKEQHGRKASLDERLATCKLILLRVGDLQAKTGS